MINIDTRLLPKIDEKELWLLIHIVKRIGPNGTCWPSNTTLVKDTGWHIEKLQKVKSSLEDKGLLKIKTRLNSSNVYKVMTDYLGVFINASDVEMSEFGYTGKSDTLSENPTGGGYTGKSDRGILENPTIEVLSNEVLYNTHPSDKEPQKSLFSEEENYEVKTKKKIGQVARVLKPAEPCHGHCKALWQKEYPELGWNDKGLSGRMLNEMLAHLRTFITEGGVIATDELVNTMFEQILAYAKGKDETGIVTRQWHWASGKPISTFRQQFGSIIHEMKNGKQDRKGDWNNLNSEDRIRERGNPNF